MADFLDDVFNMELDDRQAEKIILEKNNQRHLEKLDKIGSLIF